MVRPGCAKRVVLQHQREGIDEVLHPVMRLAVGGHHTGAAEIVVATLAHPSGLRQGAVPGQHHRGALHHH